MKAESATIIADVVEHLRPKGSYSIWIWRLLVGAALQSLAVGCRHPDPSTLSC